MRHRFFSPFLALAASALALSLLAPVAPARASESVTGSGTVATQDRPVQDFTAIAVAGSIDLVVRQTGREAVQVSADDNLLPYLETRVETASDGGRLVVRWKPGLSVRTRSPVVVKVEVKALTALAGAGSGDITVQTLQTPTLKVSLSGSGDFEARGLSAGELSVSLAGSGDAKAAGSADRLRLSLAGSGDLAFGELQSDEVSVSIAGSGDARVNAAKALNVSIAGSGDVVYSGNPPTLKTSVAGSGTVTRR